MHRARWSALVVLVIIAGIMVSRPLVTRGQAPRPSSAGSLAAIVSPAITPAPWLATGIAPAVHAGAASVTARVIAEKVIEASAFESIDFRPPSRNTTAATYPMPERKFIRSGLWEVGITELGSHYHTFDCPLIKRVSRNHIYGFPTWREALVAGYQPDLVCTPSPLHEFIQGVRDERRRVTQRGQPASEVKDAELSRIRREVGAVGVSEKVLQPVVGKMLGRIVIMPTPEQEAAQQARQQFDPNDPTGQGLGLGFGGDAGGLPPGSGGMMGGPSIGGMTGGGRESGS